MEVVLESLAACPLMDIIMILRKKKTVPKSVEAST
jgi:uncharacterized OsmC-like protein